MNLTKLTMGVIDRAHDVVNGRSPARAALGGRGRGTAVRQGVAPRPLVLGPDRGRGPPVMLARPLLQPGLAAPRFVLDHLEARHLQRDQKLHVRVAAFPRAHASLARGCNQPIYGVGSRAKDANGRKDGKTGDCE